MRTTLSYKALQMLILAAAFGAGLLWPRQESRGPDGAKTADFGLTARAAEARAPGKEAADKRSTDLVCAADAAVPALVSIGVERTVPVRLPSIFDDGFFGMIDPFPMYAKREQRSPYFGSGIVVDPAGVVVTNHHVIEGANRVFVTLADKKEYEARLLGADAINDIAVLKVKPPKPIPAARLGDSDDVRLGEWVLAIGNPYGAMLEDPSPTVTAGVVSALNRFFSAPGDEPRLYEGMIQTDAAINPGNSGGALVNVHGEVIGVNTFIFSASGGSIGIGFAIPINRIKRILDEIERYGHVRQARWDMDLRDITPYIRRLLSLSSMQGVLVYRVEVGGGAQAAGIRPGDVIRSVNDRPVNSRREFAVYILSRAVGEKVKIVFDRQGKTYETEYTIQARPE